MKHISVRFIALCCMLALAGCGPKSDVIVLKLAHGLDLQHPVHIAMEYMGKRLKEKSNGKIVLEIFPNEQLGSEREMVEQVQLGCVDMVKVSTSPLESFIPVMGVFSVPYIFRDSDHFWRVMNGPVGKRIMLTGEKVGLRGLCYYDSGSRSFYTTRKPVLTPDDLNGMKIRVQQSKTSIDMVKALGASPTPIAWGELYTALQQGVVDGAENNPPSFYTSRHYEVCKHYSLDEHTRVPDIILISKVVWDGFPEDVRQIIQEAADESVIFQRKLWDKMTAEALAAVKEAGVTVYKPDKATFVESVKEMHRSYDGTEVGDLIKQIMETE